jgi:hypothetical protein
MGYAHNRRKDGPDRDGPGNVQNNNRGPKLLHQAGFKHHTQPDGKGIEAGAGATKKHGSGYVRSLHHHEYLKGR